MMPQPRRAASVAPDLAALLADLAARGLMTPEPAEVGIAEARRRNRAYFRAIAGDPPKPAWARPAEVVGQTGAAVSLAVVAPAGVAPGAPALLYLHGGGYAFGDLDTHAHIFRWLAEVSGMVVFGLHYRRTPEHAFPAQIDDGLAAAAAIRGADWAARFGHDPSRLLLFGDSAGAHLAMGLLLALRTRGLPQAAGAALAYGMYRRRFDSWSHLTYGDGRFGLSSQRMRWFWDQLMAGHAGAPDSTAEPLLADLAGLPPLALYGAQCDCLLDDTLELRDRAAQAGVSHSFHLFEAMPHGFLHLPGIHPAAREALVRIGADLKRLAG